MVGVALILAKGKDLFVIRKLTSGGDDTGLRSRFCVIGLGMYGQEDRD